MENIKRYFGADANEKPLPWIFYRMIEAEPFNGAKEITYDKVEKWLSPARSLMVWEKDTLQDILSFMTRKEY